MVKTLTATGCFTTDKTITLRITLHTSEAKFKNPTSDFRIVQRLPEDIIIGYEAFRRLGLS